MGTGATAKSATPRWLFGVALALIALYALNIALGMLAIKGGVKVWRVGDVGEFVLVLLCMGFFVAGLVVGEAETAGES